MKYTKNLQYVAMLLSVSIHVNAALISSGCLDANRKAVSLLQEGRFAESETQLSEFLASLNHSPENTLCFGITLNNLAYALMDLEKRSDAEEAARGSLQSFESAAGIAWPLLCWALLLLGISGTFQGLDLSGSRRRAAACAG